MRVAVAGGVGGSVTGMWACRCPMWLLVGPWRAGLRESDRAVAGGYRWVGGGRSCGAKARGVGLFAGGAPFAADAGGQGQHQGQGEQARDDAEGGQPHGLLPALLHPLGLVERDRVGVRRR